MIGHQGAIGAAVGVATAGVIVLLVTTDGEQPDRPEPARQAFALPEIPKTLPGQPKPKIEPEKDEKPPEPVLPKDVDSTDPSVVSAQTRALFDTGALSKNVLDSLKDSTGLAQLAAVEKTDYGRSYGRRAFVGTKTPVDVPKPGAIDSLVLRDLTVTPIDPSATDVISAGLVRAHLIRRGTVRTCFDAQEAAAVVVARFTIAGDGRIRSIKTSGDPDPASCIASALAAMSIPQSLATGVEVTLTFAFRNP